jgi:hypothetical protein
LGKPFEFALNSKYGAISHLFWHQSGLLAGFQSGFVASISTEFESMGQELYQAKIYKSSLAELFVSLSLKRCVSCGDNEVKVQDLSNLNVCHPFLVSTDF